MVLEVKKYPDPILFEKAVKIEKIDDSIKELVENMRQTMVAESGVGLAANQIGSNLRLFIIKDPRNLIDNVTAFINPFIFKYYGKETYKSEGCLSFPGERIMVKRHENIKISYTDINGKLRGETIRDWTARIVQHEFDHLLGKTFKDRI